MGSFHSTNRENLMQTIAELNSKAWYRLLKVLFLACYLPYFFFLWIGVRDVGRDYHPETLPPSGREAFRDANFLKLDEFDKVWTLKEIDPEFRSLNEAEQKSVISAMTAEKREMSNTGRYDYKGYYTWSYLGASLFIIFLTLVYVLVMEVVRRTFYYVVIGKIFPKE